MNLVYCVFSTPLAFQHLHFNAEELLWQRIHRHRKMSVHGVNFGHLIHTLECAVKLQLLSKVGRVQKLFHSFLNMTRPHWAAMVADFSISFFSLLQKEFMLHGHWLQQSQMFHFTCKGNPLFHDVVAYFPTLPKEFITTKSHASFCHTLLWHHCMKIVLSSLAHLPLNGTFESLHVFLHW